MTSQQASQSPERAERKRKLGVLAQRRYRERAAHPRAPTWAFTNSSAGQRKKDELRRLQDKVTNERAANLPAHSSSTTPQTSQTLPLCEETASFALGTSGDINTPVQWDTVWNDPCMSFDDPMFLDLQLLDVSPDVLQPHTPAESAVSRLSDIAISQYQFQDDRVLQVPELDLMATASVFAKILNCEDTVWSFTASRILDMSPRDAESLPTNFRPTEAQRKIMHHPVFDLLPWSSVRTRLICTFAQRTEARPPAARDEMALMRFFNDLDDPAEGLRVYGEDRSDCNNWEVGQQILNNWWWAFNVSIVVNSNKLRARRGAPRLILGAP